MKQSPLKGDWINLLNDDLEKVNLSLEDEELVSRFSKDSFKQFIKKKMRVLSQHELECIKQLNVRGCRPSTFNSTGKR